jgi:peroxiredoxin
LTATTKKPSPWYADFRFFLVLLAIFFAFLLMSIFSRDHGAGPGGGIGAFATGKEAPDLNLAGLSGGNRLKLSELRGKVVFLNFWATWCAPCRQEVPAIQSLYKKFLNKPDFVVAAVACDQGGESTVREFVDREGLAFPIYLDSDMAAAARYGVTGFPETYLIGRDGKIREKFIGPRDWDDPRFRGMVNDLLAEKP